MGHISISVFASVIVFMTYYFLLTNVSAQSSNSPSEVNRKQHAIPGNKQTYKRFLRSSLENNNLGSQQRVLQLSRSKIPIELDLLLDEDESFDKSKRYDDYGHMRFGKRAGGEDQFDDYGHMRFGKRGDV